MIEMKLLYGTTNKAKIKVMENAVRDLGIELISLNDLDSELPMINENGRTPLENAEIKAKAYYKAFHIPVFSCDSGLYFDGLEDEEQPGLYIRRVNGKELTDEEMIDYYASLAKKYGGELIGRYRNAIHLILDEKTIYSSMDMSIATEPFVLTAIPHTKRVEGFPLDSLSKDIKTGEYYYDLEEREVSTNVEEGLRCFFEQMLDNRKKL